jgi:hypothetical protein
LSGYALIVVAILFTIGGSLTFQYRASNNLLIIAIILLVISFFFFILAALVFLERRRLFYALTDRRAIFGILRPKTWLERNWERLSSFAFCCWYNEYRPHSSITSYLLCDLKEDQMHILGCCDCHASWCWHCFLCNYNVTFYTFKGKSFEAVGFEGVEDSKQVLELLRALIYRAKQASSSSSSSSPSKNAPSPIKPVSRPFTDQELHRTTSSASSSSNNV